MAWSMLRLPQNDVPEDVLNRRFSPLVSARCARVTTSTMGGD